MGRKGKEKRSTNKDASGAAATGPLTLQEGDDVEKRIGRIFRTKNPSLGEDPGEAASAPYLAASFVAYAADKHPESREQWAGVLTEVLEDAGSVLDDDDNEDAVQWVIGEFVSRKLLVPMAAQIEEGAMVLALLAEDDDWHQAVVQQVLGEDLFLVMFLEYGKPQETSGTGVRLMEQVVDDEGAEETLKEGSCEMCGRHKLLTFHHLIPKDVHTTYLKKRLPAGVEGEPTRQFLNSYGTMVCRQCHSFVHRLAPNDALAKEYNSLAKILDVPSVQSWIKWASVNNKKG